MALELPTHLIQIKPNLGVMHVVRAPVLGLYFLGFCLL